MTADVKRLTEQYAPQVRLRRYGRIVDDVTEFMHIDHGDIILLEGEHFLVFNDARERGFGYTDAKHWVKRCRVLENGEQKILKLCFYESFTISKGSLDITCYRSPQKESRILELVRGDLRFMQGRTLKDTKENPVRIVDIVHGGRLDMRVVALEMDHEQYFYKAFPGILAKFLDACRALSDLHAKGERHGDVWRDHLRFNPDTDALCWIDFDYAYELSVNPFGLDLFGLGEILIFLTGKGTHGTAQFSALPESRDIFTRLRQDDFSLLHKNMLVNLKKIYPYIPEELNRVLLHFSQGAEVGYETVDELLTELEPCLPLLQGASV